jgi:hypothetical protein
MYFIMFLVADYLPPSLHTLTCLESAIRSLVVYILVEFSPRSNILANHTRYVASALTLGTLP